MEFDNCYSWVIPKNVKYRIDIYQPFKWSVYLIIIRTSLDNEQNNQTNHSLSDNHVNSSEGLLLGLRRAADHLRQAALFPQLRREAHNRGSSRHFLRPMLPHNLYLLLQASQLRLHAARPTETQEEVQPSGSRPLQSVGLPTGEGWLHKCAVKGRDHQQLLLLL